MLWRQHSRKVEIQNPNTEKRLDTTTKAATTKDKHNGAVADQRSS